jgi:hypothetical protein
MPVPDEVFFLLPVSFLGAGASVGSGKVRAAGLLSVLACPGPCALPLRETGLRMDRREDMILPILWERIGEEWERRRL